jgi:hypothetical protein
MNLFSRSYEPGETIIEPYETVTSLIFVTKGHIAICEPTKSNEPLCILNKGNYFGDFQILNHVPCFFSVKAIAARDFVVHKNASGQQQAVFTTEYFDRQ